MGTRSWNFSRVLALGGCCALGLLISNGCMAYGEPAIGGSGLTVEPVDTVGSVEDFQAALSPYGEWVVVAGVGNVWRPYSWVVGADFVPYGTGGQWVYSDWGWTFASNWDWGWAPFHYGRWFVAPAFGWVWAPGTEWAPAWVDWRWGDGYACWAPLPPRGIRVHAAWTVVDRAHFLQPNVGRYRLPPHRATAVIPRTTEVRDYTTYRGERWNRGPQPRIVERDTGRSLPRTTLSPPMPGHIASPVSPRRETARTPPPSRPAPSPGAMLPPPPGRPAREAVIPPTNRPRPEAILPPAARPSHEARTPPASRPERGVLPPPSGSPERTPPPAPPPPRAAPPAARPVPASPPPAPSGPPHGSSAPQGRGGHAPESHASPVHGSSAPPRGHRQ